MAGPLPVGAWAFCALTFTVVTKTLTFQQAFAAYLNDVNLRSADLNCANLQLADLTNAKLQPEPADVAVTKEGAPQKAPSAIISA